MSKRGTTGLLYVAPSLILLTAFYILPALANVALSLLKTEFYIYHSWAGLKNYRALANWEFLGSLLVSGKFLIGSLFSVNVVAFLMAVALYMRSPRFSLTMRAVYYIPVVMGGVATASVWRWLLSTQGPINDVLRLVGLGPYTFLGDPSLAVWSVIFIMAMGAVGSSMILWSAALGQIPVEIIEAARVDGASTLRIIWSILMPLTRKIGAYLALVALISSLQIWEHPWIFTSGGPRGSTTTVALNIYNAAFAKGDIGLAAAMSMVPLVLSAALALYLMRAKLV